MKTRNSFEQCIGDLPGSGWHNVIGSFRSMFYWYYWLYNTSTPGIHRAVPGIIAGDRWSEKLQAFCQITLYMSWYLSIYLFIISLAWAGQKRYMGWLFSFRQHRRNLEENTSISFHYYGSLNHVFIAFKLSALGWSCWWALLIPWKLFLEYLES